MGGYCIISYYDFQASSPDRPFLGFFWLNQGDCWILILISVRDPKDLKRMYKRELTNRTPTFSFVSSEFHHCCMVDTFFNCFHFIFFIPTKMNNTIHWHSKDPWQKKSCNPRIVNHLPCNTIVQMTTTNPLWPMAIGLGGSYSGCEHLQLHGTARFLETWGGG